MALTTTVWHNPKCSKSRQALTYLTKYNINPIIRLYLDNPPTISELENILSLLNIEANKLIRTNEKEFKDLKSYILIDEKLLIKTLTMLPKLIERPIIIRGEKAVIGRPTSLIDELF